MGILRSPPPTGEGTEALTGPAAVSWEVELGGGPRDTPSSSRCEGCEGELTGRCYVGDKVVAACPWGRMTVVCYAGACDSGSP